MDSLFFFHYFFEYIFYVDRNSSFDKRFFHPKIVPSQKKQKHMCTSSVTLSPDPQTKFHPLGEAAAAIPLPQRFTYPFCYEPHPLCRMATAEVQSYLATRQEWAEELQQGKMFGVLVVKNNTGKLGYLAAFSGNLAHSNLHDFFVPPVYDLLQPDGFFCIEEKNISAINHQIESTIHDPAYLNELRRLADLQQVIDKERTTMQQQMKSAKAERDILRKQPLSETKIAAFIRESQFQKAEYKRMERQWKEQLTAQEANVERFHKQIITWEEERKQRSSALQRRIFGCFQMQNAKHEVKDLIEIFAPTPQQMPPAGAGECAAPKLLQYAYLHHLQPLCMAEFWWGNSPKQVVRHHGQFYPACQGKCGPILRFMLQGLAVDENPLSQETTDKKIEICYEDEWLTVVSKPAGLLSAPGKESKDSVAEWAHAHYPQATGPLLVHRLDMATSGLLLIAKTKEIHQQLQQQFKERKIHKRYIAWLDGIISTEKGSIDLPLAPDYLHRPCQQVDKEKGKQALTHYEVIRRENGRTWVAFYPQTGRTHQLRLHAAHPEGLNAPIVGDSLYGIPAERLYLHAESLDFVHPVTGQPIHVEHKLNDFL